jgi:hypothetical protein
VKCYGSPVGVGGGVKRHLSGQEVMHSVRGVHFPSCGRAWPGLAWPGLAGRPGLEVHYVEHYERAPWESILRRAVESEGY